MLPLLLEILRFVISAFSLHLASSLSLFLSPPPPIFFNYQVMCNANSESDLYLQPGDLFFSLLWPLRLTGCQISRISRSCNLSIKSAGMNASKVLPMVKGTSQQACAVFLYFVSGFSWNLFWQWQWWRTGDNDKGGTGEWRLWCFQRITAARFADLNEKSESSVQMNLPQLIAALLQLISLHRHQWT